MDSPNLIYNLIQIVRMFKNKFKIYYPNLKIFNNIHIMNLSLEMKPFGGFNLNFENFKLNFRNAVLNCTLHLIC